jgi:hypothetical protein
MVLTVANSEERVLAQKCPPFDSAKANPRGRKIPGEWLKRYKGHSLLSENSMEEGT